MKICTDLEQSKKLIELGININTSDCSWILSPRDGHYILSLTAPLDDDIPAWSLSTLLNLLPNLNNKQPILTKGKFTGLWYCYYEDEIDTMTYDNAIDAVFEMIILLNENNKI